MPPRRVRGVLSKSINSGSVVSPGVKAPYQCTGVVNHQNISFNFFEIVQFQINQFPSRQYGCPFIANENEGGSGRGGEQVDDCHFQRDLGICIVQRNHNYCRVPAGQIERQGRLGFQKFPRLKRMAAISKSILRNLCKVGIPGVGSFCIKNMPSNTILPLVEKRSTQPSNRCILTEPETSRPTLSFSFFFNNRKSSSKGQNRRGGSNSNNSKLASTALVQSGSGTISSRSSASTSVK